MIQLIKKISLVLIAAGVLVILGGFAAVDFDVYQLSTNANEEIILKTSEISMDQINKLELSVTDCNLKIEPVKGDKFILTYPENESLNYELNVTEHKIELKKALKIKFMSWFEFAYQLADITVQVPEAYLGSVHVTSSHGDAEINDLKNLNELIVDYKYGDIQMNHINAKQAELNFAHGTSKVDAMTADSLSVDDSFMESEYDNLKIDKAIDLSSRHGSLVMMNTAAKVLSADLDYSSLQMEDSSFTGSNKITYKHENVTVQNSYMDNLRIVGSYGGLQLMDNKVNLIEADIKHGSILGALQGKKDDYAIAVTIDHGESAVEDQKPESYKYTLDIVMEYGDAEISFTK